MKELSMEQIVRAIITSEVIEGSADGDSVAEVSARVDELMNDPMKRLDALIAVGQSYGLPQQASHQYYIDTFKEAVQSAGRDKPTETYEQRQARLINEHAFYGKAEAGETEKIQGRLGSKGVVSEVKPDVIMPKMENEPTIRIIRPLED